jgi:hypothetical protein
VLVVVRFAEAVRSADTRLRTAELLRQHDKDGARRIVSPIAWPSRRKIDSKLRLQAVRLISTIDPARRTAELAKFSEDPSANEPERYAAAKDNIENDRSTSAMIKFGNDAATSDTYRRKAAAAVGEVERGNGARMYILITQSSRRADRLPLLEAARKLDPAQATEELVALARDRKEEPEDRLKAVGIAAPRLNTTQKVALYKNIADTTSGDHALAAARHVVDMRRTDGQRLIQRFGRLCGNQPFPGRGCRFSGPNSSTHRTRPSGGGWSYNSRIRSFFCVNSGSFECFQVFVDCQEMPASLSTCLIVSRLKRIRLCSAR